MERSSMKLSKALEEFLELQIIKGNSIETYNTYKKRIGYFISFCEDIECSELCLNYYSKYVSYLKQKKLSSHTIKTRLNDVRVFVHFLIKNKYTIPFEIPTYKAVKRTIVVLTLQEIDKLLNYFDTNILLDFRNLFIVALMLDCGLRVSEVLNLSLDDFVVDNKVIKIYGKGAKERLVPLTPLTLSCFNKYISINNIESGKLFNLTTSGVRQMFSKIKDDLNFKEFHPHFLRHTFATYFLINGGDINDLKIILGHTTFYMTSIYVHIAGQMVIARKSVFSPCYNFSIDNKTKKD